MLMSDEPAFKQFSNCSSVASPLVWSRIWIPLEVKALTIWWISFLTNGSPPISKTIFTPIFLSSAQRCLSDLYSSLDVSHQHKLYYIAHKLRLHLEVM